MASEPRFRFVMTADAEQMLRLVEEEFDRQWEPISVVAQPDGRYGVLLQGHWQDSICDAEDSDGD